MLVTVQLESDSEQDYLDVLKSIRSYDRHENIIDSIRVYNSSTYDNPVYEGFNPNKKLLVFYSYANTEEKQDLALKELQKIIKNEIKVKHTHNIVKFDYDDNKFTHLTKEEYRNHNYIDCYLPLSKVEKILNIKMPCSKPRKGRISDAVRDPHFHPALQDTPYELHLIDNSALLRIYPVGKSSEWLDIVTSKVLRHKGMLYAKKELLDQADSNLITRIIGSESEQIQKDIKRIFDDKDLLERNGLFDVSRPSLIQRLKNKHPIYNYFISKVL